MHFGWSMPVEISFGAGCSEALAETLGDASVVVMAFEPATALGLQARLAASLGARLLDWVPVADGLSSLARARELAARVWPRLDPHVVLLAIGGGTTLDLAKLLRCRPDGDDFESLASAVRGGPWPRRQCSPLWLMPTTAGTGSEVTRWATIWDTDGDIAVKRSLDEPWGYADRAWVDPMLTMSCPLSVTRDTALDALSHALEAIWNRHANPVSDSLAVAAARRILAHLPECLLQPHAIAPRTQLALAALEAGLAFSQTRTALAHALSYAVTLEQGTPHGLACAIWLPTAWRLAMGRDARVAALLQSVLGVPPTLGVERLQHWLSELGVDARPESHGIHDAQQRVSHALGSARGRNFVASA
jgi:phosphonate metabolism-associated iron-containing alcohol dehydrogenase